MSSEAYERERQNNSRLDELAGKVSALRGVTVDIYDNARDHAVIDSNVRSPLLLNSLGPFHTGKLTDIPWVTERSLLQLRHLPQRLRRPAWPHGAIGQQSRYIEVVGDNNRDHDFAVVD
jgi:hypothetical protein